MAQDIKDPKQMNIFSPSGENFNKKYNLEGIQRSSFERVEFNPDGAVDLSGKVTTTSREVIKRFFKNPYNIVASAALVFLILMSIVVTYTTMYNVENPISQAQRNIFAQLPPRTFGDFVNQNLSFQDLLALQQAGIWIDGLSTGPRPNDPNLIAEIIKKNIDGTYTVHWNPWAFIDRVDGRYHSSFAGTDSVGRDIWSRVWTGAWHSFKLAFFVAITEMILGVAIGAYVGYHAGGWADLIISRIVNVVNLIPPVIWLIVLTFLLPKSLGFWSMFISLTLIGFLVPVSYARLFVLKIKDEQYLQASHAIGVSKSGVIFKHALPNVLGKLSVVFVRRIPSVILLESMVAFLGLSPEPGTASLGNIINDAKSNAYLWWYLLLPTAIIAFTTLSLQIISNGLHDAFDPKTIKGKA